MKVIIYASKKAIELLNTSDIKDNYGVIRYDEYTPICKCTLKAKRDSYMCLWKMNQRNMIILGCLTKLKFFNFVAPSLAPF